MLQARRSALRELQHRDEVVFISGADGGELMGAGFAGGEA